ncbi:FAD-dependent monooxygenase [Achromobacter ruhlandii]|uniref:2,4-dichlorophenol 6-monooxygenase n=2 Tax=Achromobacter ruhlandii TaxID=72557 RepID=A0ABM8LP16_9BURK|nr:FAD-dependent monooxygenase [Achromobacter ruhlandii]AKP92220.1 putative oxygenase [Achromobacter xylosoxidans]MCZ8434090.1 FAD-dependent monooxygenase [Achromobacter ruhlandii]MDC6152857.1 FAD-dependent monooxygenase [Achromobacter ruhlandii]MDD7980587.1 FAD-dependent monooxygenase [Achromobacter ruhlandii]CAB3940816.1 2,4-dichlorophenol 6-monooxygenase [Achromobacter ruhlandii]
MSEAIEEVPVLIVGGGPVGLAMSIDLARRGVHSVLLEQGDGTIEHPRTGLVAIRTMEAFRMWDIAHQVRECGFPEDYNLSMVFCTSLNGLLLDREPYPSMRDSPTPPETPEKKQRCPQLWLQPILTEAALASPQARILFEHRFLRLEQHGEAVSVDAVDTRTGATKSFRARYVLGCDGATSQVREQLGIALQGRLLSYSVNILIRAEGLADRHAMGQAERYMFVGPDGMWGNLTVVDGADIWRLTVLGSEEKMDLASFDAESWVRRALGGPGAPEIEFEVLSVTPWRRSEMLADSYGHGRIFLVGDSAHTMSPTGGMGMNTGIQEVLDLGWKLQGMLEGWGGHNLLRSYELERRPIAQRNTSFSTQNFRAWQDTPDPSAVCDDTPAGARTRAALGRRLRDSTRVEWESMGLQIGHRYEQSPICVPDGTPPVPDDFRIFVPNARPGARAPHAWLKDGRSTLDLFGESFVLLDFGGDESPDVHTLLAAAQRTRVPLRRVVLDEPEVERLYAAKLVLVRPDGHVAWRGGAVGDARRIIDVVRGAT